MGAFLMRQHKGSHFRTFAPQDTIPATTGSADETSTTTTQSPVGPKPGPPRNVSVAKVAQGWVVFWLPPVNKSVPVAYYRVEFREGTGAWQHSESISKDSDSHLR